MKQFVGLLISLMMFISVIGCGQTALVADFGDAESFEAALNEGENLEGKVVSFTAGELNPNSALGYNVWAGEHLNFISSRNPDIKEGDVVAVKVSTIESQMGSWIITYEKLDNVIIDSSTITKGKKPEKVEDSKETEETSNEVSDDMTEKVQIEKEETKKPDKMTYECVGMDAVAFKDYFGDPSLSAYVAIKNTTDVPITFNNLSLDFEDNDGKLIGSDTMPNCIPEAIKPGQVGYIYTYHHSLDGMNLDNGFHLRPNGEIVQAKNFYEIEVSDVVFNKGGLLDLSVVGRATNNTGSDQFAEPGAVYFDADGKVVGFCYGIESISNGQTITFEISGDMMSNDMDSSIVDHVEVYVQGNGW